MKFNCVICSKEFIRFGKQCETAKCCSMKCLGKYSNKTKSLPNVKCTQCSKVFHMKRSQIQRYARTHGYFCSPSCYGKWKSKNQLKENNPNFRNKMYDSDGSRLIWSDCYGRLKLHHAICFDVLNIDRIPKGYCVHHRDCNHQNNDPENLVILNHSDHRWIHKQYGSATLWAFMNSKISLQKLTEWSNSSEKSKTILPLNILIQKESGVFKSGEFIETPETDNNEPSQVNEQISNLKGAEHSS